MQYLLKCFWRVGWLLFWRLTDSSGWLTDDFRSPTDTPTGWLSALTNSWLGCCWMAAHWLLLTSLTAQLKNYVRFVFWVCVVGGLKWLAVLLPRWSVVAPLISLHFPSTFRLFCCSVFVSFLIFAQFSELSFYLRNQQFAVNLSRVLHVSIDALPSLRL